ncbi:MAG: tRNA pseudouridine(38-40) synthase TruA [Planctomycetes bacterium]|nr:tRNA pseudouridine(38-40) synthase TruA [Planctomycetota bacterium]
MPETRNIRLKIAYDGTNYCGWQIQNNGPTLQAVLERAIFKLTGEQPALYSAGRTDSGVHALGQVANFQTNSTIPAANFRGALQAFLPNDVIILESAEVPLDFHSTFRAVRKQYRYLIDNSGVQLPFLRSYAWWIRRKLNVAAMQDAAQVLVGTHDFRCFETDWPNKATSVRTVSQITFSQQPLWNMLTNCQPGQSAAPSPVESGDNGDLPIIAMDIFADGFLYNMVRAILGTLVNVGRDRWSRDDVARILAAQDRTLAGCTAPACGLYLVQVWYD